MTTPLRKQPFQFGLASLFAVTLAVGLLLWAWRVGLMRLTFVLAVLPATILVPIYLVMVVRNLLKRL